jgi:putative SOS response-associated peptidase YedK
MCGRARLSSDVSEIKVAFRIPPERPTPKFPPSWNVAPTDSLPVVRYDAKDAQRNLDMLRWGLIPIVTTVPNQLCAEIHNRMPVILKPDAWPVWYGSGKNRRTSRSSRRCWPPTPPTT